MINNIEYFKDKKIIMILPAQRSKYSNLYEVFNDLYLGLNKINIKGEVLLIRNNNYVKFPYFNIKEIEINYLKDIMQSENTFFIIPDDYNVMNYFFKNKIKKDNLLIWANYFYGHKFIFEKYKNLWKENFGIPLKFKLIDFIPLYLLKKKAEFYYIPMQNNNTVAQSYWTDLLLERVYNIFTMGILYIPIEFEFYNINNYNKEERILVFIGEEIDTDLITLQKTIQLLKSIDQNIEFDYFGNENIGSYFNKKYNENIHYLGKLERKDLSMEYSRHLITIAPIYNGTFEMVPIHSLLCGTPVISYIQPFMEVTGLSNLIANINNKDEIIKKFNYWKTQDLNEEIINMKNKILKIMDNKEIAQNLLNFFFSINNIIK